LRENKTFSWLELDQNLRSADAVAQCGIDVIDLNSGSVVHWIRIEGMGSELYDIVCFSGVVKPQAIEFKTDEIRHVLRVGDERELCPATLRSLLGSYPGLRRLKRLSRLINVFGCIPLDPPIATRLANLFQGNPDEVPRANFQVSAAIFSPGYANEAP